MIRKTLSIMLLLILSAVLVADPGDFKPTKSNAKPCNYPTFVCKISADKYKNNRYVYTGKATGVLTKSDIVATCYHVAPKGSLNVRCVFGDTDKEYKLTYLRGDENKDIVFYTLKEKRTGWINTAPEDTKIQLGDKVYLYAAIPDPVSQDVIVVGYAPCLRNSPLYLSNAIIDGNSGVPIINEGGQLIGLGSGGILREEKTGLCYPIRCSDFLDIRKVWKNGK